MGTLSITFSLFYPAGEPGLQKFVAILDGKTKRLSIQLETKSGHPPDLLAGSHKRLLSLDFLRGFVMVILILGETDFFYHWHLAAPNGLTKMLSIQFQHSVWQGLHFWDLILPAFMFAAGAAMALSYAKQTSAGIGWAQAFRKTIRRSFWLLFWGILIYAVRDNKLSLQFSNVLTELSFANLICFLLIRLKAGWQLAVSVSLLLLTEALYRFTHVPGFDQPFTDQHNFGNYLDLLTIGRLNPGYGTTLNILPAAVSSIWGLMAGQLIQREKTDTYKLRSLVAFGIVALAIGLLLDISGLEPILKWISNSAFICATGGITVLFFAACYYWIDIQYHRKYLSFFTIVGMNSIFIYLFFNFIGTHWMNGYITALVSGLLAHIHIQAAGGAAISCLVIFLLEWSLCYFLYKKKLFFKL